MSVGKGRTSGSKNIYIYKLYVSKLGQIQGSEIKWLYVSEQGRIS